MRDLSVRSLCSLSRDDRIILGDDKSFKDMKKLIQEQIRKKAIKLIQEHKPIVIAVTGSVGKTSTRNAIVALMSQKFTVGTTIENYNNEFGVPLTILGCKSPGRSIFGWLRVLFLKPKKVPQVFVLEYGIDNPGDMSYLGQIAQPNVAVMTEISPVHVENFRSVNELLEEKAHLLEYVPDNGLVVLNGDDKRIIGASKHAHAPIVKFGFSASADVKAVDYQLSTRQDFSFEPGEQFSTVNVTVETSAHNTINLEIHNILGKAAVKSILAAIAVAKHFGIENDKISRAVNKVKHEPGRMMPIPGIKGSLILDDSYNAAPASMAAALEVLNAFSPEESAKRIAVLGHMAELGQYTEEEHRMLGMRAAEAGTDLLLTVGEMSRDIRRGAIEAGIPKDHTEHFEDPVEAGRWLDREINKGDIVLIKGSQSARMEKVVKDVMAEPMRAEELLVRQSGKWIE